MSAQRTNRASHHEARQKVTPLNQTERFARRTRPSSPLFPSSFQPTPLPLRPPMVVQNDVVAFPARPELEIYDDSDEEMEMRPGSDNGEGDISGRTRHDDDDAESVPETECTYGDFEGLEENDSEEESDAEIEYEVEEGPITIDLEIPWDRQASTPQMPSISRPVASNWRLERSLLDSHFGDNSFLAAGPSRDPIDALLENVNDDRSEESSPRPQNDFPLGMMPGATTSTADVTTVSALFRSRDDTGLSFMLGDAVSFLGDDLPEDLGDHDYN